MFCLRQRLMLDFIRQAENKRESYWRYIHMKFNIYCCQRDVLIQRDISNRSAVVENHFFPFEGKDHVLLAKARQREKNQWYKHKAMLNWHMMFSSSLSPQRRARRAYGHEDNSFLIGLKHLYILYQYGVFQNVWIHNGCLHRLEL